MDVGNVTNLNKTELEQAVQHLQAIATLVTYNQSLSNMQTASDISADTSGMDDDKGGWSYLSEQVNATAATVAKVLQNLSQVAASTQAAMQASVGSITGTDSDNAKVVNNSGTNAHNQGVGR